MNPQAGFAAFDVLIALSNTGKRNPERDTDEFIRAMETRRQHVRLHHQSQTVFPTAQEKLQENVTDGLSVVFDDDRFPFPPEAALASRGTGNQPSAKTHRKLIETLPIRSTAYDTAVMITEGKSGNPCPYGNFVSNIQRPGKT